ncbi:MAG: carbohydrate-binding domain-containing protein [Chitinispirillales bacterium]|nr:carbohydrate-binding domain-containing protein [Chitinispirillales bacterium]
MAALVLGAASCNPTEPPPPPGGDGEWNTAPPAAWEPQFRCSGEGAGNALNLNREDLGLDSTIVIKFNGSGAPTVTVTPSSDFVNAIPLGMGHLELRIGEPIAYNIILSGTTANGSLKLYAEYRAALYLNGVNIANPSGPAISIQSTKQVDVRTVDCDRRNILQDGANYGTSIDGEDAKGAFFSEGQLIFQGRGSLEVRAKNNHAIVSDDYIEVEGGDIIVYESKNDGIHANGRINIKGGALQIKCVGDAIQNERLLPVTISGGKVAVRTTGEKGHGIASEAGGVIIQNSPDINISLTGDGSKGIRSHGDVKIQGGAIYIDAHGRRNALNPDDDKDSSAAAGIKADGNVEISGGKLTIKCTRLEQKAKGINADGDVIVSGGETKIHADGDGVKVRGAFRMSGGTLYARSRLGGNSEDIDCGENMFYHTGGALDAQLNGRKNEGDL